MYCGIVPSCGKLRPRQYVSLVAAFQMTSTLLARPKTQYKEPDDQMASCLLNLSLMIFLYTFLTSSS